MKRMSKMLVVLALLVALFSVSALAALPQSLDNQKEKANAGIKFGENGAWGFVYTLPYGTDDKLVEEGAFLPFFNKKKDGPFNINIKGAYITDGQEINTVIGSQLGVDYSPYVAKFHKDNRILGIRVYPVELTLGPVNFSFDGAYMFALIDKEKEKHTGGNELKPRTNDILFGVKASVEDIKLALAVVRYEKDNADPSVLYDYFYNVGGQLDLNVIPGLTLKAVGAYYQTEEPAPGDDKEHNYLYEVTADYKVLADLSVRAGVRNSYFSGAGAEPYKNEFVRGGDGGDKTSYVGDVKPIKTIYDRDFSINAGFTYNFDVSGFETKLSVDYDTTNPKARGDFDDQIAIEADSKYMGFSVWQKLAVLVPDADTDHSGSFPIEDATANRYDYYLKVKTPEYDLPVPLADRVFAAARLNVDWDHNYIADNRLQVIPALEIGIAPGIPRLDGLYLGAIVGYDMATNFDVKDTFKYALLASYDAPNGIRFRLEYLNSEDYKSGAKVVHNNDLKDRYEPVRYYGDSKFHGIRFAVAFPL